MEDVLKINDALLSAKYTLIRISYSVNLLIVLKRHSVRMEPPQGMLSGSQYLGAPPSPFTANQQTLLIALKLILIKQSPVRMPISVQHDVTRDPPSLSPKSPSEVRTHARRSRRDSFQFSLRFEAVIDFEPRARLEQGGPTIEEEAACRMRGTHKCN
jgi:hypothetical protein